MEKIIGFKILGIGKVFNFQGFVNTFFVTIPQVSKVEPGRTAQLALRGTESK